MGRDAALGSAKPHLASCRIGRQAALQSVSVNSTFPVGPRYPERMVLSRIRRFAWLLVLVLVAGLTMPMLASAAPCDTVPVSRTHGHADGSVHSHAPNAQHAGFGTPGDRSSEKSSHCPGCLIDAACAVSCLGVAVLHATADWTAMPSTAVWGVAAFSAPPGVAPAGDIDPPRTLLHS